MKLKLLGKVLLSLCSLAILALALLSYNAYRGAVREAESIMRAQLAVESDLIIERMDDEMNTMKSDMRALASLPGVKAALAVFTWTPDAEGEALKDIFGPITSMLEAYAAGRGRYEQSLGLISPAGKIVANIVPDAVGIDVSELAYFREASAAQGPLVAKPELSKRTGLPVSVVIAPVRDERETLLGFVYTAYELSDLSKRTVEKLKIGKTGGMAVTTADGLYLMHRNQDWLMKKNISEVTSSREIVDRESGDIDDDTGSSGRMFHFAPMRSTGWKVVTSIDRSEIAGQLASLGLNSLLWGGAGLLVLIAGIVLVIRPVVVTLRKAARFAQAVAAGDFGRSLDIRRNDELGDLGTSLVDMKISIQRLLEDSESKAGHAAEKEALAVESMRRAEAAGREAQAKTEVMLKTAERLETAAAVVSSASAELSVRIGQSEQGAAEQAGRIAETVLAMEKMNDIVAEVSRNALSAAQASGETREKAVQGSEIVRLSVTAIRKVQQEALTLKRDMVQLGDTAQSISQILSVISDIADQTNLLALNAAIEAARAGDAGRGFAVVADEVRKLAEKTMRSTTDVGEAIAAIQKSADQSITQMDNAVKAVEEATGYAARSGQALEEIVSMADGTAEQVRAINAASEEQSASSKAITASVDQVNDIAGGTARAMQEAAGAVAEVARQAHELSGLIEDMKRG